MMGRLVAVVLLGGAFLAASNASAEQVEVIALGGFNGLARLERNGAPRAGIVLVPGGDGVIGLSQDGSIRYRGNQLVRTQGAYANAGLAALVVDQGVPLGAAVAALRQRGVKKVTLAGTSRGTLRIAEQIGGLSGHERPDAVVFTAGFYDRDGGNSNVQEFIRSPQVLPPTMVVHHRNDGCRVTPPVGVAQFAKWAGSKARIVWLNGGTTKGNPCEAQSYHGFLGLDGQVVATIAGFAR